MSSTSRATGTPTSTLSKRLAELESSLGVRLIQRTSRTFNVTDLGRQFYRHAEAMLIEAEAAKNLIKRQLSEPAGTVRITASVTTAQMALSQSLPMLAEKHPQIEFIFHATNRFVDIVQEGFDIAVRAHFHPLADSELSHKTLGSAPNYLVGSEEYLSKYGRPSCPEELFQHMGLFSSHTTSSPSWALQSDRGATNLVRLKPRLYANDPNTLLSACLKGLGIACLPRGLCQPLLNKGALQLVLPDWHGPGATITLLMPSRRGQLPAVRTTIDFLSDHLVEMMSLQ